MISPLPSHFAVFFYLISFFFFNKLSFIYGLPQPANLTLERVIAVLGGEKEERKQQYCNDPNDTVEL